MSYDVFLTRFRDGEAVDVRSDAVWDALEQAWDLPPDEYGFCTVRRGDDEGDLYAVQAREPIDSLMFNHAGPGIYELMYDIAVAGDMVIVPPDAGPFLVREEQRAQLPADLADDAVLVNSGEHLLRLIEAA